MHQAAGLREVFLESQVGPVFLPVEIVGVFGFAFRRVKHLAASPFEPRSFRKLPLGLGSDDASDREDNVASSRPRSRRRKRAGP